MALDGAFGAEGLPWDQEGRGVWRAGPFLIVPSGRGHGHTMLLRDGVEVGVYEGLVHALNAAERLAQSARLAEAAR
jgi:hypothetical protein